MAKGGSFFGTSLGLLKQTFSQWLEDKAPQLGAALAYYTVFSLAPLILVLLAIVGLIFQNDPAGAWKKITEQMSYFLDKSAVDVVQNIAQKAAQPGKGFLATAVYWLFDLAVVILLFAIIFKFLPDAKIQWHDVWIGAALTAIFFAIGKWALGLYLGSGSAASAYGAASSLITLLLWVYYSSQILLFGAEFTQVYACQAGRGVAPDEHAIRVETKEVRSPG